MLTALRLALALAKLSAAQATGRIAAVSGLLAVALLFVVIGIAAFAAALRFFGASAAFSQTRARLRSVSICLAATEKSTSKRMFGFWASVSACTT